MSIRVHFPGSVVAVSGEAGLAASVIRNAIVRDVPAPILCVFEDVGESQRFFRHELAPALAVRSRGLDACLVRQVWLGGKDLPTVVVQDALPDLFPELEQEREGSQEWMPLEVAVALLPELPAGSRPRVMVVTGFEDLLRHPERIRRGVLRSLSLLAKRRGVSVVLAMAGEPAERLTNLPGMQWVGALLPEEAAPSEGGEDPGEAEDRNSFRGRARPGRRLRGAQAMAIGVISAMMPTVLAMALYWFLAGAGGGPEERTAGTAEKEQRLAGWVEPKGVAGFYLE